MNKAIEKVETFKKTTIDKAVEKARQAYEEARGSFNDTGYDRYYNKMTKLEAEIEELEEYQQRDGAIRAAIDERAKAKQELEEIKKTLKNKLFYLMKAIPECSEGRSLQDFLETL